MNNFSLKSSLAKALMIVAGVCVFTLALIGSFYIAVAAVIIMLGSSLLSYAGLKPKPVKIKTPRRPLDAEYQVIKRKSPR